MSIIKVGIEDSSSNFLLNGMLVLAKDVSHDFAILSPF